MLGKAQRYIPGHTRFLRGSSLTMSQAWQIRDEIRAAKTSRPLIRSPTHEFSLYIYTRLYYMHLVLHEIMFAKHSRELRRP